MLSRFTYCNAFTIAAACAVFSYSLSPASGQQTSAVEELPLPQAVPNPEQSILVPDSGASFSSPPQPSPPAFSAPAPPQPDGDAPTNSEYELLTRGPIHEAFATPTQAEFQYERKISPEQPPAPIAEQPPQATPSGNNVQWIDGYWAWESDLGGFIWISGFYRDLPPNRTWIAGYWSEVGEGFAWNSGYWADTSSGEPTYLPPPPAATSTEPNTAAPDQNSFWIPGHWVYEDDDYQWLGGYWTPQYADWVWQPACYINSHRGFVYVSGYWDYEPTARGIPNAPVKFYRAIYSSPDYRHQPYQPIADPASVLLHLFVRPGFCNYYYGDYYDPIFAGRGFQPWYRAARASYGVAALLNYYDWKYSQSGVPFVQNMLRYNDYFLATPNARPAARITSSDRQPSGPANVFGAGSIPNFDRLVRNPELLLGAQVASVRPSPPVVDPRQEIAPPNIATPTPYTLQPRREDQPIAPNYAQGRTYQSGPSYAVGPNYSTNPNYSLNPQNQAPAMGGVETRRYSSGQLPYAQPNSIRTQSSGAGTVYRQGTYQSLRPPTRITPPTLSPNALSPFSMRPTLPSNLNPFLAPSIGSGGRLPSFPFAPPMGPPSSLRQLPIPSVGGGPGRPFSRRRGR